MPDPIAVYGAVIGTAAAAGAMWSIYSGISRERPKLVVIASQGRLSMPTAPGNTQGWILKGGKFASAEDIGEEVITVKVVNAGHKHLTVDQVGIELKNGHRLVFTSTDGQLPRELAPGQALDAWALAPGLAQEISSVRPVHPYCKDATEKMYTGRFDEYFRTWLRRVS